MCAREKESVCAVREREKVRVYERERGRERERVRQALAELENVLPQPLHQPTFLEGDLTVPLTVFVLWRGGLHVYPRKELAKLEDLVLLLPFAFLKPSVG